MIYIVALGKENYAKSIATKVLKCYTYNKLLYEYGVERKGK